MPDFTQNVVNQRFKEVFDYLEKENIIKGKSDLAKKLDTYNHVINNILKGKRNITVDQLNKLFDTYNINANYLFGLSEEMFLEGGSPMGLPTRDLGERTNSGKQNIQFIDIRAKAGPIIPVAETGVTNKKFSVPGLEGELYAIEIEGDSMFPTITHGDLLICELIERGKALTDNQVYVIMTDIPVAKRIQQIREGNHLTSLRLISDNDQVYKPYTVDLEEVQQILKVKCRLTRFGMS